MISLSFLVLTTLGHAPYDAEMTRAYDARVWVAQEEDTDSADEDERERPKVRRLVPSIGNRRILGREGMRALEKRRDDDAERSNVQSGRRALDRVRRGNRRAEDETASDDAPEPRTTAQRTKPTSNDAEASDPDIDFAARARAGKFSFDFAKAEIMDVVKAISNLTRRNFIVPEKIKSQRITILSPTKITANEAWNVFLAALEVNGLAIVRSGKFYKLVEAKDAQKSPIPTCIEGEDDCPQFTDYMVTHLMRLEHVDASQLNGIVKSLVSRDGQVTIFAPSNAMILSDYAPNIARIKRIVDTLDVAGGDDEIQIVQIQYATASEISETVKQVFEVETQASPQNARRNARARRNAAKKDNDGGGGDDDENDVTISKIVADDRTNQIIIRANLRSFEAIKNLISRIDVPVSDGEEGKVHVYYLENASAEDLASTLSSLSQGSRNPQQSNNRRRTQNNNQQQTGGDSAALFEGEVQITAETSTNSLIIVASPRDFRAMRKIIQQLDVPRQQVYVEAAILEVSVGGDLQVGTNWHSPVQFGEDDLPGGLGGPGTIGFVQGAPGGGVSPTLAPLQDPASLLGIVSGSLVGIVGESLTIPVGENSISLPSFGIILRALQSANNAQILSTPHILTTDNEEATIEVGQRIPFRRGTAIPNVVGAAAAGAGAGGALNALQGAGNLFSSTERIDVALKLTLTPQINELDKIRLEIDQQIEDIVGSDPATQQPITANRAAKTVVVVDDQQTVVLGGLIRDRKRESESKVPLLGDLPIIGWLFKSRTTELEKVNLVLVLTPYIIRDSSDFQRIFERKIKEYEKFAEEFYGSTAKYRAYVDYERKTGPLALLASRVAEERSLIENGGEGRSEQLVTPERTDVTFEPLLPGAEEEDLGSTQSPEAPPSGDEGGGEEVVRPDDASEE